LWKAGIAGAGRRSIEESEMASGLIRPIVDQSEAEWRVQFASAVNPAAEQLRQRARRFAVAVLKFIEQIPRTPGTSIVCPQLGRSASSISANYRAACRARSRAEFIAKLGLVVEEADETEHWLDVLREAELVVTEQWTELRREAGELRAIFKASHDTARANHKTLKS
jgi:four helix bundle protein